MEEKKLEKNFVVGVDVGGQTSKLGVVDLRGEVLAQTVIRSDIYGDNANAFIKALAEAIKAVIAESGKEGQIRGVGVGAPNGNYYTGTSAFAPNLAWARSCIDESCTCSLCSLSTMKPSFNERR